MILFLHGNLDLIPEDTSQLDGTQSHLPGRLDNPNPELEGLSGTFSLVDLTEEEEEDDDDADLQADGAREHGGTEGHWARVTKAEINSVFLVFSPSCIVSLMRWHVSFLSSDNRRLQHRWRQ